MRTPLFPNPHHHHYHYYRQQKQPGSFVREIKRPAPPEAFGDNEFRVSRIIVKQTQLLMARV